VSIQLIETTYPCQWCGHIQYRIEGSPPNRRELNEGIKPAIIAHMSECHPWRLRWWRITGRINDL
jgi:hypothetical protein